MKPARLIVLLIALGAAGMAAFLMTRATPQTEQVVVERTAPVRTLDVLVAAADLPIGQTLRPEDVKWLAWPADYVPVNAIQRSGAAGAPEDIVGALVRSNFVSGEPIRREKLVKAGSNAFMSAILPSGMRAVAINIDTRGANSAGGFILPNDRVDILRTYRDDEASKGGGVDVQLSETILANIKILAIGQNIQEKNGEKVVTGETATLEVTPAQAEALALAQKSGQLSLALRSLADAAGGEAVRDDKSDRSLTVVRYGVPRTSSTR